MHSQRRSRHGCRQCRQVSRKCDEAKPTCGRCMRLRFDCQFVPRLLWKDEGHKAKLRSGRPRRPSRSAGVAEPSTRAARKSWSPKDSARTSSPHDPASPKQGERLRPGFIVLRDSLGASLNSADIADDELLVEQCRSPASGLAFCVH
jgi:hypothetical protein